jgi:hypothetical protein
MGVFTKLYKLPPKQHPPKTTTKNLRVKAMISKDYKGFGFYPLM